MDKKDVEKFDITGTPAEVGIRWCRWLKAFKLYLQSKNITDTKRKRALLLHSAGMDVQDVYFSLVCNENGNVLTDETGNIIQTEYDEAILVLTNYFTPEANIPYERHIFRNMHQHEDETVAQYIIRLRQKAQNCNFSNIDEELRDQVVDKCKDGELRRKLLEKGPDLTLDTLMSISRIYENSQKQAEEMGGKAEVVNKIRKECNKTSKCYRCGAADHKSFEKNCPAKTETCLKCGIVGHFAKYCRTRKDNYRKKSEDKSDKYQATSKEKRKISKKNIRQLEEPEAESEDEKYVFSISNKNKTDIEVIIGGVKLGVIIDSGSSCNVIDYNTWKYLKENKIECSTTKVDASLKPYGGSESLKVVGSFKTYVETRDQKKTDAEFYVIEGKGVPILSKITSMKLGVLRLGNEINLMEVQEKFNKIKDFQLRIPTKTDVTPVVIPPRRVPIPLQAKFERRIKELEKLDIIEKVNGPTTWCSPVVVIPKGDDVRICIDMRRVNEAIERERYPIPTINDLVTKLNGCEIFTKLDIKWAFHQVELHPESRALTTLHTHKGLYQCKRLMFGITCAPELYQKIMTLILSDCEGTFIYIDDILIFAPNKDIHDRRLKAVKARLKEKDIKLNEEKCVYSVGEIKFLGHTLTRHGIKVDDRKVKAIKEFRRPETKEEIKSLLGLVTYVGRYIPNMSTITEPLRTVTTENSYHWGIKQEQAFKKLKQILTDEETLAYYNPNLKTKIIADASPVGLGCVLVQEANGVNRVVEYASKSLTKTERRYSQTEKEALALIWACERMHQYLYGKQFELHTDHKSLQYIFSTKSKPNLRLERWVLRLQGYDYKVIYCKGKMNIADCLSRLLKVGKGEQFDKKNEYIRNIVEEVRPIAITWEEIVSATELDAELQELRQAILQNKWSKVPKFYEIIKEELCIYSSIILRGTRIVIPKSLQLVILKLAHEGHPGIVKMKQRLRSKVWWIGIDKDAENFIKRCHGCQIVTKIINPEPIVRTKLPDRPWEHIAADFLGPLPTGDYLFVVVDYYSRFIEIEIMKSITAKKTIEKLLTIFCRLGVPESISTDNGTQFTSEEFETFCKEFGIHHHKVTPYWPQANGEVERQNRSILKTIKIAYELDRNNWKRHLFDYLLMYRSTTHSTTGKTPSELLYGRNIKCKLPTVGSSKRDEEVHDKDSENKMKGKKYIDEKRKTMDSGIKEGNLVLLRQQKQNKLNTEYEKEPYKVVTNYGSQVKIQSGDGNTKTRNSSFLKQYYQPEEDDPKPGEDDPKPGEIQESEDVEEVLRRSNRSKKTPEKYKDFVLC